MIKFTSLFLSLLMMLSVNTPNLINASNQTNIPTQTTSTQANTKDTIKTTEDTTTKTTTTKTTTTTEDTKTTNQNSITYPQSKVYDNYGYSVVKEISDPKYKGRISGTEEYKKAAEYLADEFKKISSVKPVISNNFIETYNTNYGYLEDTPTMSIDGKELKIMEEFKPHGNSDSGDITGDTIVYAGNGYEEDYPTNISVNGKIVFFKSDIKENKHAGVLDRAIIAKNKGAKAVLIEASDKIYPIASFEGPISNNNSGISIIYVSNNVFDIKKFKGNILSVNVKIHCNITRKSGQAQNVIGMIEGQDTSKSIIISACLDGEGYIPNVGVFNSAGMNASGVGAVMQLAKYYDDNPKPAVNIIFALFGSEFVNRDGVTNFLKDYNKNANIIGAYNLYDVGDMELAKPCIRASSKYENFYNSFRALDNIKLEDSESELENFNSNIFIKNKIPNAFIRCAYSTNYSLKDTIDNINPKKMLQNINLFYTMVNNYLNSINKTENEINSTKSYVSEVKHEMNLVSTRYFDIYYENDYKNVDGLAKKVDNIYPYIAWWNYYPKDNQKIKVYLTDNHDDKWATAHRTAEITMGGSNYTSTGIQNPNNHSISICYDFQNKDANIAYPTIMHELNHNLATYKLKELSFNDTKCNIQEIQGHANIFENMNEGKNSFQTKLKDLFTTPLDKITWDSYYDTLKPGQELGTIYDKTASIIYYIYEAYSHNQAKEFVYEMYKTEAPLKDIVKKIIGEDFDKFIKGWYDWYNNKDAYEEYTNSALLNNITGVNKIDNDTYNEKTKDIEDCNYRTFTKSDIKVNSVKVVKDDDGNITIYIDCDNDSDIKRHVNITASFSSFGVFKEDIVNKGNNKIRINLMKDDIKSLSDININITDENFNSNYIYLNLNKL